MADKRKTPEKDDKDPPASGKIENREKGATSTVPANKDKQPDDEKTNKVFDHSKDVHSDQTGKAETTGVQGNEKGKALEGTITCPPGKSRQEVLNSIGSSEAAKIGYEKVKMKCVEKTEGGQGGGEKATRLPDIPIAGQGQLKGAGKMVTNPVSLSDKVVNYQGQQYFNPQGGLPTPPSGYSWQGRDFATLVSSVTGTALNVTQTLQVFNQAQAAQTSTRTPAGTNPSPPPSSFPLTTDTNANPVSPFTDTGKYIPSGSASRTGNAMGWAMDQLRREGVPEQNLKAAAAHLVGQATMESGLDPTKVHDQGTGYGIYGARLDRRSRMFNWLDKNGFSRNSLEGQVRYMAKEAMNDPSYSTTRNILVNANANNFASQVPMITKNFENPAIINYRTNAVLQAYNTGPGGTFSATGALPQTGIGGGGTNTGIGGGAGGSGSGGGLGGTGLSGIGAPGSSIGNLGTGGISGGSAAGGSGGAGGGGSLSLQYQRPQQEGQGGYIAQAAAATIAARTNGLGSLAASSLMSNMAGGLGGGGLGGLASSILGGFGGQALSGSVSPNYNVPNWSGGQMDAGMSGVNPMSAVGNVGIPANSASMFPMGSDFSNISSGLGSTPNILSNTPTTAPLASTNNISQNLGTAANQAGISQTPQGQFGQFGQSITGAGGGSSKGKSEGKEGKEQENKTERPTQSAKRAQRKGRADSDKKEQWDKKLDKEPPEPPRRPADLATPYVQAQTGRKSAGEEGPENQSVKNAPGIDEHDLVSDFTGALRNLSGGIPGLESMLMRLPNQFLGQFIGNMPAGLQSLLPQGLIPGLSQGPIGLNNLLQMVGGGALGGAAGQMIRSMAGGIPVASLLTQSLQAVPITQVFGALGQDIGTSAAAISNTLGSITNVASRGLTGGIPVNSAQLNQAISYALASSGSALSVPINTLGVASQITNNPVGSLVNIAMGKMISNGSVPILPTNLSGTNAALLAGLNQQIPQEDAQLILTIGQITGLLPPNVRNLIPPVSSNAFGGPTNAAENSRNNSVRQTDSKSIYGDGSRRDFEQVSKPSLEDTRNIPYGMKLSDHYTLYNLTLGVAVCNGCHKLNVLHLPVEEVIQNLMLLARNILEPIRAELGPPTINSGYRGDDPHTKQNDNWQRSLHGYGRAADLSWGSYAKISQAVAYAQARLHATENLHEKRWHHIAVAGGTGGKGGNASSRTPEGNIQQGNNSYKGFHSLINYN